MLFHELLKINEKPTPYEYCTTALLWNDAYTSQKMLEAHLDPTQHAASRNREFMEASLAWLTQRFSFQPGMTVCDFGCGPGLYTTEFARQGATVTGIDFSTRSIDYAKDVAERNHLPITYIHQNYLEFATTRQFDLVTMIYCDFCALSPAQRGTLLDTFGAILAEGGHLLFDVHTLSFFDQKTEGRDYDISPANGFWSPQPYVEFHNSWKYEPESVLLDTFTIIEEERTRNIYNWLQCYTPDTLRQELSKHDLDIIEYYADVSGAAYTEESETLAVIAQSAKR